MLITGASSGFGRACAEHLASLGHRVYGTSRKATFDSASPPAASLTLIPMDVNSDDSVAAAIAFVSEREGRIDVVVNNAGVGLAGAVEETRVEEAQALFETNFFGVHRVCRAVLPVLRQQRSGLIVNIGSIGGLIALPFQPFYSASKAALESLSDALRLELAPFGIRVVVIEPGDFRTDFTAQRVFSAESGNDSPYAGPRQRALAVVEHDEHNGADPIEVAHLLARIIAARRPSPRYTTGPVLQRVGAALKSLMPDRFFDRVMSSIYKL